MRKNPLRRLSAALRATEAYWPYRSAETLSTPSKSTASLSLFLSNSKAAFLKDVKEDRAKAAAWTVVMGNEAGDLGSIASSIAYAWIQSEVNKKPAVPLIQIERADLHLRAENLYALNLAGLSETQDELLTLTEIEEFKPFPFQKFALVDHNRLGEAFTLDNPNAEVVAVVDHHQDEGLYRNASPRVIAPCGSCVSHVAALCPDNIPAELATLLLTAILIDTDGLKPGGKAIQTDRDSALSIARKSTYADLIPPPSALSPIDSPNPNALYEVPAIEDLTEALAEKKVEVWHLGALDLLRRDFKEYTYPLLWVAGQPSIEVGLSTVPTPLKALADGKLEEAAVTLMERRGLTVLGVLTSFRAVKKNMVGKNTKGKHKREMAWIILEGTQLKQINNEELNTKTLAEKFWKGLEADDEIKVEVYKKFQLDKAKKLPENSKWKVYKQGNAKATRKTIAPILKDILEGSSPPSAKAEETTPQKATAPEQ